MLANWTFDVAFLEDDLQLKLELKVDFFEIQFENRFHDEFSLVNSISHLNPFFNPCAPLWSGPQSVFDRPLWSKSKKKRTFIISHCLSYIWKWWWRKYWILLLSSTGDESTWPRISTWITLIQRAYWTWTSSAWWWISRIWILTQISKFEDFARALQTVRQTLEIIYHAENGEINKQR